MHILLEKLRSLTYRTSVYGSFPVLVFQTNCTMPGNSPNLMMEIE
jgi:hypothetical protein